QEYLAARAISEEEEADQQAFILARLHDPWWREVTLLLAGHLADVRHLGQRGRRMAVRLIRAVREAGSLHEDILYRDLLLAGRMACDLGKLGVDEKDREWLRALLLEVHQVWKATAFSKVAEEAGDIQALAPEWAVSEELRGEWRSLGRGEYQAPQQNRALGLIYSLLQLRDADDLREILIRRATSKSSSPSAESLWRLLADSGLRDPRLPPLCRVALLNRNRWLTTFAARTLWYNQGQHEVLAWLDGLPAKENQPWRYIPLLAALNSKDGEILEPLLAKWLGQHDWQRNVALLTLHRTFSNAPLPPQIGASLVSLIERPPSDLRWWNLWQVLADRASDRLLEQVVSTLLARPASQADFWKDFFVLPRITARLRPESAQAVIEEVISTGEVFYAIPALQHFADKGQEWALARLRELAGHEKTHTAIRALLALSELHSGDTLPRLQALAHTGPAWQRADATQALGRTEIGAALPDWCLQALSDRAVSVRAACADYLARRVNEVEDTQALAHLLALARHPSPTCKQAAWRALGELPSTPLLDGWWREWFSDNRTTPEGMSAAVALTLRWAEQPEAMQQQLESFWEENCRKPDAITTWHATTALRHAAGNPRTPADLAYDMLRRIAEIRAASDNP
ncbi:MAG: hypothetical protein KKG92_07805, partial [Gammaproteobacteria bacterium]|nr:hypothetical protein [Gammaproteobacteria bacterium]